MKKAGWKKKIFQQMQNAGTYRPAFDSVVDTLSVILEQRDRAFSEFIESGGLACVEKVSDRGSRNLSKNPYLSVWDDLNRTALAYWRELGLSPAALKKASTQKMNQNRDVFAFLLDKINNDEGDPE